MSEERAAALEERIDRLEQSGQYDEAIEVLAELQQLTGEDQRWHVAWMHVLAGRRAEADAIWAQLEREKPADAAVPFLAGSAHAEAQEPEVAAELFGHALTKALRVGTDGETLRQILAARTEALEEAGLPSEEIDEVARRVLAKAAAMGADVPIATPFFDAEQFPRAVEAFPDFAKTWAEGGHEAYARELDLRMRAAAPGSQRNPVVVPLTVEDVVEHAARHDVEPDFDEARARTAFEVAREGGEVVAWPPGRNDPCWCGSGRKYKRCCGR